MGSIRRVCLVLAVLLAGGSAAPVAFADSSAPVTGMFLTSQPGDFLGQGRSYSYLDGGGDTVYAEGAPGNVWYTASSSTPGDDWDIRAFAPAGQTLVPGQTYPAYGFPNPPAGYGTLEVSGQGRYCGGIGSFTVEQYSMYNYEGSWFYNQLDIRFTIRCGTSAPALTGRIAYKATDNPSTAAPVSVTGSSTRTANYGTAVGLAGTAPPGAPVGVWFHEAGSNGYTQRRTLIASSAGTWNTSYVANDDYRIYATSGTNKSAPVLVQVAPTIAGGTSHVVPRGTTYTITGTGIPRATITLHFHKAGTATNDYSIQRTRTVADNGTWTRSYLANVDYRFYATLPSGQASPTVLVQAR